MVRKLSEKEKRVLDNTLNKLKNCHADMTVYEIIHTFLQESVKELDNPNSENYNELGQGIHNLNKYFKGN